MEIGEREGERTGRGGGKGRREGRSGEERTGQESKKGKVEINSEAFIWSVMNCTRPAKMH